MTIHRVMMMIMMMMLWNGVVRLILLSNFSTLMSLCDQLFGMSWDDLLKDLRPMAADSKQLEELFEQIKQSVQSLGSAVLCGSSAKGTRLREHKEIDVVVNVPELSPETHQKMMINLLSCINVKFPNAQFSSKREYRSVGFTHNGAEVDVLLATKLDQGPSYFLTLSKKEDRMRMAACVSHLQRDFIASKNQSYKDLVLIAKKWRDKKKDWPRKPNAFPCSYLMELLMWRAYQQSETAEFVRPATEAKEDKRDVVFRAFLQLLSSLSEQTFICWNAQYEESVVSKLMHNAESKRDLLPFGPAPIVMDPANPTANVADRVEDWQPLIKYAQQTLQSVKR